MENQENKFYQEIYDSLLKIKKNRRKRIQSNYLLLMVLLLLGLTPFMASILDIISGLVILIILGLVLIIIATRLPLGKTPEPTFEDLKLEAKYILEVREKEVQQLKKLILEGESDIEDLKKLIN